MGEAKKKRENTIKEVDALDQQQLEEYKVSECGASNRRVLLFYQTDNAGRIVKFETENLQLTKREERLPHSKNTPGKVKGQDHAGHLAADRFGGSPKIDNLVSQLSDVNLKQYKKIEDEWAAALKETPPKEVKVNVEIIYDGNSKRPSEFIVEYEIDGRYEEINILN